MDEYITKILPYIRKLQNHTFKLILTIPVNIDNLVNSTGANISMRSDQSLLRLATRLLSSWLGVYEDQAERPPAPREALTL